MDLLGDGKTPVMLDPPTEQQLLPFESMFHLCCFLVALVLPRVCSKDQIDRWRLARVSVWLTGTRVRRVDDIIVSNDISEFDAIAMLDITPAYILGYDFYKKMLFFKLLGDKAGLVYVPYVSRQQGNGAGRDAVRQIIVELLARSNKSLAAFPESGLTNGRKGLLQYHKFLFSLEKSVQSLAIRASDGPFAMNINDETSTFLANVLWYLFVPWHTYTVQFLPCNQGSSGGNLLVVAQRVMKATADALEQQASPFMYRDKIAYTRYKTHQRSER
ncbi:uncharacterized protein IUM83_17534 [Phytophthora cinnamomi]|uniref:uncharacterized protein n=1 Tax=Phytophthora cinnamomi TaxID=4785 RepID=UPI00355A8174|nr:hypothetical protein IUM83_17534 [Phytophthora cinnamomi]